MSSTHCEPPSTASTGARFDDGQLQVRHAASVVPGFELMEIRQHLRDDADVHGDGWIVLARFRTWVGIPGWRRCRRRGPTLAERGARTASTIPSHTLGGGRTASGRHHPSSGTIR